MALALGANVLANSKGGPSWPSSSSSSSSLSFLQMPVPPVPAMPALVPGAPLLPALPTLPMPPLVPGVPVPPRPPEPPVLPAVPRRDGKGGEAPKAAAPAMGGIYPNNALPLMPFGLPSMYPGMSPNDVGNRVAFAVVQPVAPTPKHEATWCVYCGAQLSFSFIGGPVRVTGSPAVSEWHKHTAAKPN